jgi:hypothetical protein
MAEGETIWRRLRRDRKIVVLADDLEGALIGSSAELERDNIIRAAMQKAHQEQLRLIVAALVRSLPGHGGGDLRAGAAEL